MKKGLAVIRILRGIATVGILLLGGYYVYTNLDAFRALLEINWVVIGLMAGFILINIFASAAENAVLYQSVGIPIGNLESFRLTNISAFLNLILPQGGSMSKAIYLKQKYGFPYSKTSAVFLGVLVIYLLIGATVMLITNLITVTMKGNVPFILWIAAMVAFASGLLFMIEIPQGSLLKKGKVGELLDSFSHGWNTLRTNKSYLVKACIWQFVIFVSAGAWISIAYYGLGIRINPLIGISLAVLISFSNIFVLVPGNLGIQEAAYGYFTYLSGMTFAQGVVVSALTRAALLAVTLLLTPLSWYYLIYKQNINLKWR